MTRGARICALVMLACKYAHTYKEVACVVLRRLLQVPRHTHLIVGKLKAGKRAKARHVWHLRLIVLADAFNDWARADTQSSAVHQLMAMVLKR